MPGVQVQQLPPYCPRIHSRHFWFLTTHEKGIGLTAVTDTGSSVSASSLRTSFNFFNLFLVIAADTAAIHNVTRWLIVLAVNVMVTFVLNKARRGPPHTVEKMADQGWVVIHFSLAPPPRTLCHGLLGLVSGVHETDRVVQPQAGFED